MIRFIPDYSISTSGSSKNEAEGLSTQLTKESGHIFCSDHPDYENVMLCAVASNGLGVKIVDTCCDKFKQTLVDRFSESLY